MTLAVFDIFSLELSSPLMQTCSGPTIPVARGGSVGGELLGRLVFAATQCGMLNSAQVMGNDKVGEEFLVALGNGDAHAECTVRVFYSWNGHGKVLRQ